MVNEIYNSTAGAAITEGEGQTAWADPGHDAPGNMTGVPKPSDMTGQYTCVYDAWNRLAEVRDGQSTVAAYRYDGLNRRIRKAVASPSAAYDYYYNAAWQVLEVRKDGASLAHEQYVWSPRYIDAPILRDRNADPNASTGDLGKTGSGLDERLYYLTDAQMNVTCLVDASGDAVERYAYDPYGRVTIYDGSWTARSPSASLYANEVLYCGYRLDTETGLYCVRNRMYTPLLGRWMQRDPLGYANGLGLYEYVASAPLCYVDWDGAAPGTTTTQAASQPTTVQAGVGTGVVIIGFGVGMDAAAFKLWESYFYARKMAEAIPIYGPLLASAIGAFATAYGIYEVAPVAKKAFEPAKRAIDEHNKAVDDAINNIDTVKTYIPKPPDGLY